LSGELDLATAPELEHELQRLAGKRSLVLDLCGVEFIDSTGLSVLVKAHKRATEAGRSFKLIRGGPQAQRLLALTGLNAHLTIEVGADEPRGA
ncbi:MAG: STAS domain-containing protein, partial [Solirubrobacteraceae bacterium]